MSCACLGGVSCSTTPAQRLTTPGGAATSSPLASSACPCAMLRQQDSAARADRKVLSPPELPPRPPPQLAGDNAGTLWRSRLVTHTPCTASGLHPSRWWLAERRGLCYPFLTAVVRTTPLLVPPPTMASHTAHGGARRRQLAASHCAILLLAFLSAATGQTFTCTTTNRVASSCSALADLYSSTSGASWKTRTGWATAAAGTASDYCSFTGITCTGTGAFSPRPTGCLSPRSDCIPAGALSCSGVGDWNVRLLLCVRRSVCSQLTSPRPLLGLLATSLTTC